MSGSAVQYWDVELPQDACAAGRVISFGKQSSPVVAGSATAYASGLSPDGRLVAARGSSPTFFGSPGRRVAARPRCRHVPGRVVAQGVPVEAARSAHHGRHGGAPAAQVRHVVLPGARRQQPAARCRQGDDLVEAADGEGGPAEVQDRPLAARSRHIVVMVGARMGPDLVLAHELADAADAISMARFRARDLQVSTKPDKTPGDGGGRRGRDRDSRAPRRRAAA